MTAAVERQTVVLMSNLHMYFSMVHMTSVGIRYVICGLVIHGK